jgi:uncharacterized protein YndB with AHSA1/START domain
MPTNGFVLRMTRTLAAPRRAVWRAMTDPEEIASWWGPRGYSVPSIDFEPVVGATYRIAMQPPGSEPFHLHGQFREVEAPVRLAYTFTWEPPDPEDRETLVELTFEERGDATEVSLTQGEFATEARLELHDGGWTDSFDGLEALLS